MGLKTLNRYVLLSFYYFSITTAILNITAKALKHSDGSEYSMDRTFFPPGFVFGTASSAYQYEGAATEGGRGPSIWDTFTHNHPDKIADHGTADVAIDSYHRYKEDAEIMKNMGMDAYRFSISWSRLLPDVEYLLLPVGNLRGGVNKEGIQYYNNLINELLDKGIKPFVTLFHWDLPNTLEEEYGGFLSRKVVKDFEDYVDLCFKEFGDRVKHWITLNEPWSYSDKGYAEGLFAPGRCSDWQNANCFGGDSGTEPYLVSHHQLLSHAAAVKLYRQKYQGTQKGKIGITNFSHWFVPYSDSETDQAAASRAIDFMFGWYMDPIITGDYPHSMRSFVGDRLPKFSEEESNMLKGSFDFLGVNYYTACYARYAPEFGSRNPSYLTDAWVQLLTEKDGVPIGEATSLDWLVVYPRGIYDLLLYIKQKYGNHVIYITENGLNEANNASTLEEAVIDHKRVHYYYHHLLNLQQAIEDGVNVKGFFAWSLFDNFEWSAGFSVRFGLNYIDYENGQRRYPKLSAQWFKKFLTKDNQESPSGEAKYRPYSDL